MENYFNNCDICEKFFATSTELKEHTLNDHESTLEYITNKSEKVPNEILNNDSNKQKVLKNHRNYKCDSCGNSFTQSGNLKEHIEAIHEKQRNYKCDSCAKSFPVSGNLKRHIKTLHEGQKITNVIINSM